MSDLHINIQLPPSRDVTPPQSSSCFTSPCTPPGCVQPSKCKPEFKKTAWRKICLFALIFFLIFLVVANLTLTLWLMSVMRFNYAGMGPMRITSKGIRVSGETFIHHSLIASSIQSREGQPIVLISHDNFTISASHSKGGAPDNRVFVDAQKMNCKSGNFTIEDPGGKLLFSADPERITVGADTLSILGDGGAVFDGSVSTSVLRSNSGKNLSLESLTRSIEMKSARSISMESKAGGIDAISFKNILLKSLHGSIKLESGSVFIPNLQRAVVDPEFRSRGQKARIYQLCACENGRLFLASPKGVCETYDSEFICR